MAVTETSRKLDRFGDGILAAAMTLEATPPAAKGGGSSGA
jgi:hypothetical protein